MLAVQPEGSLVYDAAWVSIFDPQRQKPYYWNQHTNTTHWERPLGCQSPLGPRVLWPLHRRPHL